MHPYKACVARISGPEELAGAVGSSGVSGSGKTTLLSCLASLLRATEGTIHVGSTEITGLAGGELEQYRRATVGIVFQAFNLVPSLTARENVAVADEPTAHLDFVQVEEVLGLIRELASPGRLVVVATHDDRFTPLADRVIELAPKRGEEEAATRSAVLAAGGILFTQGEPAALIYVVEEGEIELFRPLADGGEEVVSQCGPGHLVRGDGADARPAALGVGGRWRPRASRFMAFRRPPLASGQDLPWTLVSEHPRGNPGRIG